MTDGGTGERAPRAAAVGDDPEAFHEQAREFAGRHGAVGLDFSPASLARLDELVADEEPEWTTVELEDGREATVAPLAAAFGLLYRDAGG